MSKIDHQALREVAERAIPAMERLLMLPVDDDLLSEQELKDYGVDIDALNAFKFLTGPETVLALLDERERNQQYIKRRDQENEEIALTVGKLLIENGRLVADTLRHLADNEIDSDYFAITSTNENGTEIDHEMAITDYALQAAGTVDELVAALESAEKRIAELEAEPVSQAYNLAELIEGMEVSIDVSTCDADLGNRYFGTVTEALELDTAKNGYILLVQDAEPNFDVNGNSPVTPDSWISCSERMPVIGELNWRTGFPLLITCEIGVIPAYYGFVSVNGGKHYGFMESFKYGDDRGGHPQTNEYGLISNVTHWMPLPEPPQEMK